MILHDHQPQDQLGQFLLGSSYLGGRSAITATEDQSIATGDADVVFFLADNDTITSARTSQWKAFQSVVDISSIHEEITREQYSFMSLLSTDLISRTEAITIDRLVSAELYFPGLIEQQSGVVHVAVQRYFNEPTIVNFYRNTFVSETKNSVMPFIVLNRDSFPVGAGTATTDWPAGTFDISITRDLTNYRQTLTFLGYTSTYAG